MRTAPLAPVDLLVLYIAYSAQVLGDGLLGGVLSAFVGALCVTPVCALVARQPSGPAALVSFTPAFSLLVPGAIGLVGVADVLGGDAAAGDSLVATLSTMVAIALGVLAGSSLSTGCADRLSEVWDHRQWTRSWSGGSVVACGGLGEISPLQSPVDFMGGGVAPLPHPVLKPGSSTIGIGSGDAGATAPTTIFASTGINGD